MIQKIIRVGNSAAVIIPRKFLHQAKLRIEQEVAVETNSFAKTLLVKPKSQADKMHFAPEFYH